MSHAQAYLTNIKDKLKYALITPTFNPVECMIENPSGIYYSLDWRCKRTQYNLSKEPMLVTRVLFRDVDEKVEMKCTITLGELELFNHSAYVDGARVLSINQVKELIHALSDYYKYLLRTHLRKPLPNIDLERKLMTVIQQLEAK